MFEDLFDDGGVSALASCVALPPPSLESFDAGDDSDGAAAAGAGVDIDLEHAFEPLRPGHGGMAFGGGPGRDRATAWSAPGRGHLCAQVVVGGKHPMKPGEIHARGGDQCGEPGDKVQWLEDHMGGAVSIRSFQSVTDVAPGCQRQTLDGERGPGDVAAVCGPSSYADRGADVASQMREDPAVLVWIWCA